MNDAITTTTKPKVEPRLLTVHAAAEVLGHIGVTSVRRLIAKGKLVPVRLPGLDRLLVTAESVNTLIALGVAEEAARRAKS